MIIQWEKQFVELDVSMAEHKVNVWNPKVLGASSWEHNEYGVLASSEQESWRETLDDSPVWGNGKEDVLSGCACGREHENVWRPSSSV